MIYLVMFVYGNYAQFDNKVMAAFVHFESHLAGMCIAIPEMYFWMLFIETHS